MAATKTALVGIAQVELRQPALFLGAQLIGGLAANRPHQALVRVQGDDGDASFAGKIQQIPVVGKVHAPVLEPAGFLEEGLLAQFAGNPAVKDRLLSTGEHLHAEGLTTGVQLGKGLEELQFQAMGSGIVVGFAEVDDTRIAGQGEHLRRADDGAGRQVNDLADLGRRWEGVGVLGIAHQ